MRLLHVSGQNASFTESEVYAKLRFLEALLEGIRLRRSVRESKEQTTAVNLKLLGCHVESISCKMARDASRSPVNDIKSCR